jgi:hypothetical protein
MAQVLENSGFPVPAYMLKLKKARRKELKVPKRESVARISKYDKTKNRMRSEMIKASKAKRKAEGPVTKKPAKAPKRRRTREEKPESVQHVNK